MGGNMYFISFSNEVESIRTSFPSLKKNRFHIKKSNNFHLSKSSVNDDNNNMNKFAKYERIKEKNTLICSLLSFSFISVPFDSVNASSEEALSLLKYGYISHIPDSVTWVSYCYYIMKMF